MSACQTLQDDTCKRYYLTAVHLWTAQQITLWKSRVPRVLFWVIDFWQDTVAEFKQGRLQRQRITQDSTHLSHGQLALCQSDCANSLMGMLLVAWILMLGNRNHLDPLGTISIISLFSLLWNCWLIMTWHLNEAINDLINQDPSWCNVIIRCFPPGWCRKASISRPRTSEL